MNIDDIDLNSLSEPQLRALNHRIVERLKLLHQVRMHGAMIQFAIGERVHFRADGRWISETLLRYNQKSVTVIADGGARWTVSPSLLTSSRAGTSDRARASSVSKVTVEHVASVEDPIATHADRIAFQPRLPGV